jgi:Uma2 family endonuclease
MGASKEYASRGTARRRETMALTVTETPPATVTPPVILHLGPAVQRLGEEAFEELSRLNPEWRLELTAEADLVIMPPAGGETGRRNYELTGLFRVWEKADGTGVGFDSSTGFTLPNGAKRSPDLAWVKRSRWEALTQEERERFSPLCPDFVVELRFRSDPLKLLQDKMAEYIANGAQLGWLIDPLEKKVYVYRPSAEVHCLEDPPQVSGDPVLPGFVLDLNEIWG